MLHRPTRIRARSDSNIPLNERLRSALLASVSVTAIGLGYSGATLAQATTSDTVVIDNNFITSNQAIITRIRPNGAGEFYQGSNGTAAAERIVKARKSRRDSGRLATPAACVAVATADGSDPSLAASAGGPNGLDRLRWQLVRKAGRQMHAVMNGRATTTAASSPSKPAPSSIELPSQVLATRLGVGRKAARTRLDHAIEAGVVMDVSELGRSRTAPRCLMPGTAAPTPATRRRGAFPSLAELRAAVGGEDTMRVDGGLTW